MPNLLSKNENLEKSAPVIGAEILKLIRSTDSNTMSIFDIAKSLRKSSGVSAKNLYYAILFLYSLDIVDFNEPYLIANVNN